MEKKNGRKYQKSIVWLIWQLTQDLFEVRKKDFSKRIPKQPFGIFLEIDQPFLFSLFK